MRKAQALVGKMRERWPALLEAAFATGLSPVVQARALTTNLPSIGVLEKAGFRKTAEATMDRAGINKGQPIFNFRLEQPR